MQNSFSYKKFRTQTRFETEAQENSELAYFILYMPHVRPSVSPHAIYAARARTESHKLITKPVFSREMFTLVLFLLYWSEGFSRVNTVTNLSKWRQNQK